MLWSVEQPEGRRNDGYAAMTEVLNHSHGQPRRWHRRTIPVAALILATAASLLLIGQSFVAGGPSASYPPLQPLLDAAAPGRLVSPPAGTYSGPVVISRPVVLDGRGEVTIDGLGEGSVLTIDTDGAQVRGLHIRNSGREHNRLDSGIKVRGSFNIIKDNLVEDTLFGIDLEQAHNTIVRRNRVRQQGGEHGLRGDGIRLWYSFDNRITDNEIDGARDFLILDSGRDRITGNLVKNGRYGLFIVNTDQLEISGNRFLGNDMGIFALESEGIVVRDNLIAGSRKAFGSAVGVKESSGVVIEDNVIVRNAIGITLDNSPYEPDTVNRVRHNVVGYNAIGVSFLMDRAGNELEGNWFKGNLAQVAGRGGATATASTWIANIWDDYQGFDSDGDRVGDTPYERWVYSDRLWMDVPMAGFFRGSVSLAVLDFVERLAPFSEPTLLLRDLRPQLRANIDQIPPHDHPLALVEGGITARLPAAALAIPEDREGTTR
ncbi:MAG TPA: nitrous oxide reductase family maturation protein NosD [Sedimenticola thiotaurini]|uniref:Nitrous oxide reductase family maturation protein NosD n=1 Tax=Sedimenticola thiotaurini TaxID=1543721 RepID=A0A831RMW2_9GAMM|nr:nitrous oxide reductase family maturation protein NosD [Sedimenticola thiotaurini]